MKAPTTPRDVLELHKILHSDPQQYLQITNEWIRENPKSFLPYFDRHFGWMEIGEPRRALEDLNTVIELHPEQPAFFARGDVYRQLGEYRNALVDFDRGEALNAGDWQRHVIGLLFQADCHARLGNEATALAYCARLPDDFWTPGLGGAPAGNKTDVANELRRIAAQARRGAQ